MNRAGVSFRFGYQASLDEPTALIDRVREAESAGFDIFQVGDHIGRETAPLSVLSAVARAVTRIEIGTLVLNNDLRHPVVLAQELSTLDHLSKGRLEVGLGAGHSFPEYAANGLVFDPPRIRKQRLSEAVEIIRRLLDGEKLTFAGRHYQLEHAEILRSYRDRVPILVGVNGVEALTHAARAMPTSSPRPCSDGPGRMGTATRCAGSRGDWSRPSTSSLGPAPAGSLHHASTHWSKTCSSPRTGSRRRRGQQHARAWRSRTFSRRPTC